MKVTISSQSLVQIIIFIFNRFEDTAKLQPIQHHFVQKSLNCGTELKNNQIVR